MIAEQVKGKADVVLLSETTLDETFPSNQGYKVLASPSELIVIQMVVTFRSSFAKISQQN